MTDMEREAAVLTIASNPLAGDEIRGTGGCRKVRIAGRGKGKSGGYRVITYYGGIDVPVFLLTVFSKGQRADLTQRERNDLAQITQSLAQSLAPRGRDLKGTNAMSRKAYEQIAEGLREADALVRDEADRSKYRVHLPAAIDTRAIRKKLKLTQREFATRYHIPVATLRDWEQGRRVPDAPARALIAAIREEPEAVRRALKRAAA
jgi:DNA-binding transcriptional regulator YiaG